MDAAGYPHMQGSGSAGSSSCRAADYSVAWDAAQQQKRQRCQDSSSNDQVGSSTENKSLEASGPELKVEYGKNEEEDYYFGEDDDGCYDDDDDNEGSDYEVDYNQLLADKFDHLDLPPGVEATVPWLQKVERDVPGSGRARARLMIRRAASTLNGRAAAWLRRLPRRPVTLPPVQVLGSHHPQARLQPRRGVLPGLGGARGYARMARRMPPARPDGYSTSEGELEEPDDEFAEPVAAGEESDGSEEVEGYMMDFADLVSGSDDDGGEEGPGEGGK